MQFPKVTRHSSFPKKLQKDAFHQNEAINKQTKETRDMGNSASNTREEKWTSEMRVKDGTLHTSEGAVRSKTQVPCGCCLWNFCKPEGTILRTPGTDTVTGSSSSRADVIPTLPTTPCYLIQMRLFISPYIHLLLCLGLRAGPTPLWI